MELPPYSWGFLGINLLLLFVLFPLAGMRNMDQFRRYFMTKLCNLLFMRQLAARIKEKGLEDKVIATASHPGYTSTKLLAKAASSWSGWHLWARSMGQSAADGSTTLLEATVGKSTNNGDYIGPQYLAFGPPAKAWILGSGQSQEQGADMWSFSEECLGIKFDP